MLRPPDEAAEPPGTVTLSELIGRAATMTIDEVETDIGVAFLLLHRVDLGNSNSDDTMEPSNGANTADLGFLALPLTRDDAGAVSATVGRMPENDIVLMHATVSKRHAKIERSGEGGFVVSDLGSRNGTFVDGVPVGLAEAGRQREVKTRQTVRFGSVGLTFVSPKDLLEFGRLLVTH